MGIIVNNAAYTTKGITTGAQHPKTVAVFQPLVVKEEDG